MKLLNQKLKVSERKKSYFLHPRTSLISFLMVLGASLYLPLSTPLWKIGLLATGIIGSAFPAAPAPKELFKRLWKGLLFLFPLFLLLTVLFWLTSPEEPGDVPEYAARIACRMLLILLANLIFIASQNISFMLITLNELRIFRPAAQLILTAYRYFHIFTSEATNAFRARVLRTTTELPLTNFRVTGWVIEKILYRAIERSQRIYAALTLRGYDGNLYLFRKLEVSIFDFLFLAGWCSLILITVFL